MNAPMPLAANCQSCQRPRHLRGLSHLAPVLPGIATLAPIRFVGRLKALGKRTLEHFANTKSKLDQAKSHWWWFPQCGPKVWRKDAAASLVLSIMVLSFALNLLAKFSKPVSDQCKSLLGFKTLAVAFLPLPLGFLKTRRDSHWVTNLDIEVR